MKNKHNTLPNTIFRFIWHFFSEFKLAVVFYILLSLLAGLWGPFNSILIKNVINLLPQVKTADTSILLMPVGLIVLNFLVFDNITWRTINFICARYTPLIINNMLRSTMNYVLGHSHQFFQDNLSGKISKQINNLGDGTERIITFGSANFLRGTSLLLAALITAYFVHPIFCLVMITWFVIFASASMLMSKKLVQLADAKAEAEASVIGELVDTISNQSNVRFFARKNYENQRIMPFFNRQKITYSNTSFYALSMHIVQGALIAIMMVFSAYFLVKLYSENKVTIGDFALIFGLAMETGHMMWFTMYEVDEFNKNIGRCKQSMSILMQPPIITDKVNAKTLECINGKIHFRNVEFFYQESSPIFKNKSIMIESGQKIGLVGYSGGGKSTFVNLIMRLYDVTDGSILIDEHDIRDVTQDSLHESIGMIPQDPVLFQRSILENIRYGRTNATDEEVINAAKKAHAHEFITSLKHGYNTLVGERGIKLSGGQRQRIAIARALLKNAPILILDEATSQLDSVTENLIQASLCELMQNKTTIVIAHRLSTLLNMDRILVFENGDIIEDGSHNELLLQDKLYKKLWDAQVGGFLGDDTLKASDLE